MSGKECHMWRLLVVVIGTIVFLIAGCEPAVSPAKDRHAIQYIAYGADGGSAPVDDQRYLPGDLVVIKGNSNGMWKASFEFAGWTSNPYLPSVEYAAGDSVKMTNSGLVIYAVLNRPGFDGDQIL